MGSHVQLVSLVPSYTSPTFFIYVYIIYMLTDQLRKFIPFVLLILEKKFKILVFSLPFKTIRPNNFFISIKL